MCNMHAMKFSKKRSTKLTSGGLVQHKNSTVRINIETGSCFYIKEVGPDCLFYNPATFTSCKLRKKNTDLAKILATTRELPFGSAEDQPWRESASHHVKVHLASPNF